MKLYVWDDHFYDYHRGLAVVLARDLESARKLLTDKVGFDHPDIQDTPKEYDLDTNAAFYVHGGM
jgi:hypothetical protein